MEKVFGGLNLEGVKGRSNHKSRQNEVALSTRPTFTLDLASDDPPTEFRIFTPGINTSDKGDFLFDHIAAASVMAFYAKKGATLTMDYEHQALAQPPIEAPASCYSWAPEVRNGELWATDVKWTPRAYGQIKAKEYTRFSPAFLPDPDTGRVLKIFNLALTNLPALDDQQPLVAANATTGETDMATKKMTCKLCSKALRAPTDDEDGDEVACVACSGGTAKMLSIVGLTATATHAEIATALSGIASNRSELMTLTGKTDAVEALSAVRGLIALSGEIMTLTEQKTQAEALGVLAAWKANAAEVVALRATAVAAEETRVKNEFDGAIAAAITAGKLPPAEKESLAALIGKPSVESLAKLTAYLATRGQVVTTTVTPAPGGIGDGLITPEDIQLAKLTPNPKKTIEDLRKFKAEQASRI